MMTNNAPNTTATEKRICADCGQTFSLTESDIDYFLARGLQIPRRCEPCRHERRRQAAADLGYSTRGQR